jgi:hypothetical protein
MQLQVPIAGMPVHLICCLVPGTTVVNGITYNVEGKVAFVKVAQFDTVFDQPQNRGDIGAIFYEDSFILIDEDWMETFNYSTIYDYKNIPRMLKWLQQQNLQLPEVIMM